ncbi:TrbC/VirB2 family protein [Sphingomonas sp. GM_Shp_2]|uniref:TrbC/VirB2 family protein n=1 Tax=Sphingomonas sp. GM_Shp_2 TaxID=2937380 RepID=UPI00226A8B88|nr:TrbC/VirB2 family protein [Sphingomonas sp. GM_Shp_2]
MKYEKLGRLMPYARTRQLVRIASAMAMIVIAQPALAQSTSIENGLEQIPSWLIGLTTVVGAIAVIAVGYMKLTGRMDWSRAVSVLVGLGIIFSAATIVGWFASASG